MLMKKLIVLTLISAVSAFGAQKKISELDAASTVTTNVYVATIVGDDATSTNYETMKIAAGLLLYGFLTNNTTLYFYMDGGVIKGYSTNIASAQITSLDATKLTGTIDTNRYSSQVILKDQVDSQAEFEDRVGWTIAAGFDGLTHDYNELAAAPTSTLALSWNTNMNSATLTEAVTVTFTDTPASGKSASIYLMTHGDFNVGADVIWTGNTNRVTSSTINLYEFSRVNGTNYGALLTRQISTNEVQSYSTLLTDFAALQIYAQNLSFNNLDGTATIEQIPYADDGEISSEKVVRADDSRLNSSPNTILEYYQTTNDTVYSSWSVGVGTNEMIHAKAEVWFGAYTNTDRGGFTIVGEASRSTTNDLVLHTGITNISTMGTTSGRDAYFDVSGTNFLLKLKGPNTIVNWRVDGRYGVLTNADTTATPPSSNTLTNGLVAYWKMDEAADGTTPVDRTDSWGGYTLIDAAAATDDNPGKLGSAAEFEASNSETMAVATDVAALDFTSSFSVSLWARKETASVLEYLVSKWNTGSQRSWNINCSGANIFQFAMSTDGGNTAVVTAAATTFGSVTINTYYHIVATFDDTADEMTIYVNGTPDTETQTGTPFNSTQPVKVSGHTTTSSLFDGRIDELAIWNRAITSAEVAELYNSGTGYEIPLN
jgi:hypothetical protein